MKLRLTPLLAFVLLLTSCYKINRPEKPKNLISKDKMVAILVDVSLINSAKSVNKKIIEKNGIVPNEYVYKTHGVDSITFAKSNEYYAYNINEYQEIYLKAKDSLDQLKEHYKAIETEEKEKKAKEDSIKRANKTKPKALQEIKSVNKTKASIKTTKEDH